MDGASGRRCPTRVLIAGDRAAPTQTTGTTSTTSPVDPTDSGSTGTEPKPTAPQDGADGDPTPTPPAPPPSPPPPRPPPSPPAPGPLEDGLLERHETGPAVAAWQMRMNDWVAALVDGPPQIADFASV